MADHPIFDIGWVVDNMCIYIMKWFNDRGSMFIDDL